VWWPGLPPRPRSQRCYAGRTGGFVTSCTRRTPCIALAIAASLVAPAAAQGPEPAPPPPYPQPQPYPQPYPQPAPQPQPQGYPQPYAPVYQPPPPEPTGPEEIHEFDPNVAPPFGYTRVTRKRKAFIIAGAVSFGVLYGGALVIAAVGGDLYRAGETDVNVSAMWIPVGGPFLQASRSESSTAKMLFGLGGLGQTAGAIMLIYGLTTPKTLLVRNDQLSVGPLVAPNASGLSVSGRF
jgi:hypothetical protein